MVSGAGAGAVAAGAVAAGAVLLGAAAQSVGGIGFVLVCGPLLVAALGPADGVRLAVVLSLLVNVAVLARTRKHADLRMALALLLPAAVATPLMAFLLRSAPARLAAGLAGTAAIVGAAALAVGLRWPGARGRPGAVGAGIISAAMNVAAGIGGPAIALYARNADWPVTAMRSTAQVYFLGLNLVALVSLGAPRVHAPLIIGCLAALATGLLLGELVTRWVSEPSARRCTLALAAAGGAAVLARALA
ncbi:MAG: sulfite exporter TauE/SafE family protein [Mycobacteriales bacterium]